MEIGCRVYKPRRPRESPLYQLVERHLEELLRVWPGRFARRHGPLRAVVERVLREFLRCGLLENGFARLWCGECRRGVLVAFSCRGRSFCPSCEKKKQLLWAEWLRDQVLTAVAHRHIVLTIPRMLRPLFRRRRELLKALARAGAEAVQELVRQACGSDARPGVVISVATAGDLLQWHPHLHLPSQLLGGWRQWTMMNTMRPRDAAILLLALLVSCQASDSLVIANVTVIDVVSGARRPNVTVVVDDGKIVEIGPMTPKPVRGTVVDGRGKYLIPGLWDMHTHISDPQRELPLLMANGVLGVRDVGGIPEKIFALREEVAKGRRLGPHIVACGPIVDGPAPTNPPMSIAVRDAGEGRAAVQSLAKKGADCVKVHDGLPLDAYLAIADEARKVGLPLVGHIPVAVPTIEAARAGQRSIEHQIGLRGSSAAEEDVLQFEATHDVMAEAMQTGNFSLIPENIARKGTQILDHFDARRADQLYRAFAANGTYLDPTLVTQHALTYVDDLAGRDDPRLAYIPASMRDSWLPSNGMLTRYRTPAYIAYRKRELAKTLEQIPVAHRTGVSFVAGTDMSIPYVYPGFSLHDELALFVEAGLTPAEALRTATINPARLLGLESPTGTVERGKRADLVLLDADPLQDISHTKKISAVILGGKLLDRAALDRLLQDARHAAAN